MKNIQETPVDRRITTEGSAPNRQDIAPPGVFSTVLTNGREIKAREMTGKDLIFMDSKSLRNRSNLEKMAYMVSNLALAETPVSIDEIRSMAARDIKKITVLFGKMAGSEEEEEIFEEDGEDFESLEDIPFES